MPRADLPVSTDRVGAHDPPRGARRATVAGGLAAAPAIAGACSACAGAGSAIVFGTALGWLQAVLVGAATIALGVSPVLARAAAGRRGTRPPWLKTLGYAAASYLGVAVVIVPLARFVLGATTSGDVLP